MTRSRAFFFVRVGVLLLVLFGVVLWTWRDSVTRRARNDWDHTLEIAVVIVQLEEVDAEAISAVRSNVPALEDRLAEELARVRPGSPRPFHFRLYGPVKATTAPPSPESDGAWELVKQAWAQYWYLRDVDSRAGVVTSVFDSRIYLVVRKPRRAERTLAEGHSEQGGRIGIVEVELDPKSAYLPLIVAAHEMFHTLGATDKYDATGRTMIPRGLAEPDRNPLYPQRYAEIMARNRPLSPNDERVPDGFHELAVGPETAREIGWLRAARQ